MTVLYTGPFVAEGSRAARWFTLLPETPVKRLLDRAVFRTKWLRISPESRRGDWRAIQHAASRSGLEVLEFMIHSSELMPGGSPLTPTQRDAETVFRRLEEMLGDYRALGVQSCTLSGLADGRKGPGDRGQGSGKKIDQAVRQEGEQGGLQANAVKMAKS